MGGYRHEIQQIHEGGGAANFLNLTSVHQRLQQADRLHWTVFVLKLHKQVSNRILEPYQMIKDHRTKMSVGDIGRVLDGDLDLFMKTYLMQKASGTLGQPTPDDDEE